MTSESHPELTFALSLIRSEQTFDQPEQSWEFVANMAVSNYVFYKIHVQFEPLQTKIVLRGSNWHGNVYYLSDWGLLVNEFPHQIPVLRHSLLLIQEGQSLVSCERMCTILVNGLED